MNPNNKKIYVLIIIVVILVTVVASVSYGYFDGAINDTKAGNYAIVLADDYTLSVSGSVPLNLKVLDSDMLGASDDKAIFNNTSNLVIKLENRDSSQGVKCVFHYAWRWDMTEDAYTISDGTEKEYTIAIKDNDLASMAIVEQQIPNYDSSENDFGQSVIVAGKGETKTKSVQINTKFYNLSNINQSKHENQTYKGGVILDKVTCTKE